jgi:hypothetical protein
LEQAHLLFEADGYRLLCYGASLNVFPSGMGRGLDTGTGVLPIQVRRG